MFITVHKEALLSEKALLRAVLVCYSLKVMVRNVPTWPPFLSGKGRKE